ncbi:hypothetical protein [Streptomyces galbus]|uniref:Uncharacterized protein n=1 Tax=Streptomyces galbus TaxID=33898 RepID=A0ABX1IXJ1_STRGB|nr:hypothetical protein [Streptomyces galbus]NKQ28986.1 hypothetical protein [Streptomyces galbus]
MSLLLVVAFALGGLGVYLAYRDPKLGGAILVGLGIVTLLYLIWQNDPSLSQTGVPPTSSTLPAQATPPGTAHGGAAPSAASP